MFSSRRPLAIAIALVMLFAMLAPAAMAAPQWVHGVTITAPTTANPTYINPDDGVTPNNPNLATPDDAAKDHSGYLNVAFTVPITGTQVDNVAVKVDLVQKYIPDNSDGGVIISNSTVVLAKDLKTGDNSLSWWLSVNDEFAPQGELLDGWYGIRVCVRDIDPSRHVFCDTQLNSVLVQDSYPVVDLEKPGAEDFQGATFVTGKAYLMVGTATDDWGIVSVEFDYCDASNAPGCLFKSSPSWIKIADGVPTPGVANQWQATFDSTLVPDDFGYIRMCAKNLVGLSNCVIGPDPADATRSDAHKVFVRNRFVIDLEPHWNLISSPLMPYNTDINDVLLHLIQHGTVKSVWAYDASAKQWTSWTPAGPSSLATIKDGPGYWIEMAAEDELTIVGTWSTIGGVAPPEYMTAASWNLIGYTHFGTPPGPPPFPPFPNKTVGQYLGPSNTPNFGAMWQYDATHEIYNPVFLGTHLMPGAGYWLALTAAGQIDP